MSPKFKFKCDSQLLLIIVVKHCRTQLTITMPSTTTTPAATAAVAKKSVVQFRAFGQSRYALASNITRDKLMALRHINGFVVGDFFAGGCGELKQEDERLINSILLGEDPAWKKSRPRNSKVVAKFAVRIIDS